MAMDDSDRLLTAAEVAEHFDVCRDTLYRWTKRGKLPCVRTPGGRLRFRESVITELTERSES